MNAGPRLPADLDTPCLLVDAGALERNLRRGWDDVALTMAATAVSASGHMVVLDAGSKVLGADRLPWSTGAGRLPDHPGARVTVLAEHHATAVFPDGEPLPQLGAVLRVAPNHVCAAVNLADELIVTAGDAIVDRWPVTARGANC